MNKAGSRALVAAGVLFAAGLVLGVTVMQPSLVRAGWRKLFADSASGATGSHSEPDPGAAPPGEGWFRVRVGLPREELDRPRRAAAIEPEPPPPDPGAEAPLGEPPPAGPGSESVAPPAHQTSILVGRDTTLWSVSREHYGRTDAELIEALARYNRLLSPDRLELGQRLWLPSLGELLGPE